MRPAAPPPAVAILPVRVDSRRLPGKAMLAESGRPLFLHTVDRARAASAFSGVYVATDDDAVAAAAEAAGVAVIRTSAAPRTGSERCAEALAELPDAAIAVDVQGDWPEVEPQDLDALVEALTRDGNRWPTATLAAPLPAAHANDINVVKVVAARDGTALYFSRAPIPHLRPGHDYPLRRHIGVYGFRREALLRVPSLPSSGLAEAEGLEQLLFLENGMAMRVLDAHGDPWGIETRTDYERFLLRVRSRREERSDDS